MREHNLPEVIPKSYHYRLDARALTLSARRNFFQHKKSLKTLGNVFVYFQQKIEYFPSPMKRKVNLQGQTRPFRFINKKA